MRNEGTFILRYRVFNIFGKVAGKTDIPVLAECYGGPFRIYSTKEFPGLRPSTDLTKVRYLHSPFTASRPGCADPGIFSICPCSASGLTSVRQRGNVAVAARPATLEALGPRTPRGAAVDVADAGATRRVKKNPVERKRSRANQYLKLV